MIPRVRVVKLTKVEAEQAKVKCEIDYFVVEENLHIRDEIADLVCLEFLLT